MTREVPLLDRLVHDLKGPLAPLQTAAYLLGRDDLPPERRRELLDTLERQSRRLGQMIEEAGDWVRASQERLVSRHEPCELALLLDTAIGGIAGCTVEPRVPAELAALVITGDETRLLQMLATLIRHASARDPEHTPALVVAALPDGVRITVSDRGPTLDLAAHGGTLVAAPGDAGQGLALVCELPLG